MPIIYRATGPVDNAQLAFAFVVSWPETDKSYLSLANRRKSGPKDCFIKESWILEGQDREAGFVIALRRLYRTMLFPDIIPDIASDPVPISEGRIYNPKRLIGLPNYGVRTQHRDTQTLELVTTIAVEQPDKKRIRTRQIITNEFEKLSDASGPRQLCLALRDATCGLLNAFRMGYVHREVTAENIYIVKRKATDTIGYMLSRDGKSVEGGARHFNGFVFDFTVCQSVNGSDDQFTGDTEIFDITPFTPLNLLAKNSPTVKREDTVHSPIYDLDSVFWVLVHVATEIIVDYVQGRRKVELDCPGLSSEPPESGPINNSTMDKSSQRAPDATNGAGRSPSNGVTDLKHGPVEAGSDSIGLDNGVELEHVATHDEFEVAAETESHDADAPMDVDSERHIATDNNDKVEDIEMGGDEKHSHAENERDGKRKNSMENEPEMSKKARQKVNTDAEEEKEMFGLTAHVEGEVWHFDDTFMDKGWIFQVCEPPIFPAPDVFEPPQKPEYIAFAADKGAYVTHTLLQPRDFRIIRIINKVTRSHLIDKLPEFLADSPGMQPFVPLLMEFRKLSLTYRVPEESLKEKVFSRDEVEEAFTRYLEAFDKYMPEEDSWLYLPWYRGSDMLCKFDETGFLGAFASTTNPTNITLPKCFNALI